MEVIIIARPFVYDKYTAEQLQQITDDYFQYLQDNPDARGGASDYLARIGMDMKLATEICQDPLKPYAEHSKILKEAAVKLRAHFETSPAWSGKDAVKAIYLTKQKLWDGDAYTDRQEVSQKTAGAIRIMFGKGSHGKDTGNFD